MKQPTALSDIYQLRIVLRSISPLIWRRVLVWSTMTLAHLHTLLQIVFAWSDEHLHSFSIHGREYGSNEASTRDLQLRDLRLHCGERFRYVYDFGAYWACDIRLEAFLPVHPRQRYPVCIGGKRAAPPEDCRGAWSYLERLDQHHMVPPLEAMGVVAEALSMLLEADPQATVRATLGDLDAFREAVDCLGAYAQFQPDQFDRHMVNAHLHAVGWTTEETP
jgi:hypothetical protein